ncbi:hypothetical protein E2C01_034848 [Portunus trituberculatus]|uniref:Uncharacterized protein n=1 Tax=Portunus trituberculatus TaxID=210409 RepID=A0A5B7F7Q2_PORTR|nr:hypothetical protein [Portunus trituberculatus]
MQMETFLLAATAAEADGGNSSTASTSATLSTSRADTTTFLEPTILGRRHGRKFIDLPYPFPLIQHFHLNLKPFHVLSATLQSLRSGRFRDHRTEE